MIGWVTLDVGEQAILYSLDGVARIEEGPKRMFLWREKFMVMTRYSANQNEYLVVRCKNGHVNHIQGPHVMYRNPVEYASIAIQPMLSLDASEALVVYSQVKETGNVTRYIKYGPCQFMPAENEWLHSFEWHGTDPENKTRVIKGANVFNKVKIIPDQFYYNVDEVRTADDAQIRVKLMIFYELVDIEKMLGATHDPVADFVNCLCADVITFAGQRTYMTFIEQSSELNDIHNYPQLMERCKAIGFVVTKVVFRGYYAHEKLQNLHDTAIDKRSRLQIAYEQEEQSQNLTDVKLKNEMDRLKQEQQLELQQLKHDQKMESEKLKHTLHMVMKETEDTINKQKQQHGAELNAKKTELTQDLKHLTALSDMDVRLTDYLVRQSDHPVTVTSVTGRSPVIHLHHSGPATVTNM